MRDCTLNVDSGVLPGPLGPPPTEVYLVSFLQGNEEGTIKQRMEAPVAPAMNSALLLDGISIPNWRSRRRLDAVFAL